MVIGWALVFGAFAAAIQEFVQ